MDPCFTSTERRGRLASFAEEITKCGEDDVFVNYFRAPTGEIRDIIQRRLGHLYRGTFEEARGVFEDYVPSTHELVVGLVEYWKERVLPTLDASDSARMLKPENVLPQDVAAHVLVTLPFCENWLICDRMLGLEAATTSSEYSGVVSE